MIVEVYNTGKPIIKVGGKNEDIKPDKKNKDEVLRQKKMKNGRI